MDYVSFAFPERDKMSTISNKKCLKPMNEEENKVLLPHHEQKELCTTRLPYRQGRKLTAEKVYTITRESNHLLIFGVPSLNLRQETKALFSKFGKLSLHIATAKYLSEQFTETFHAVYENIHQARIAKRMLDTKNFYGGLLHVCYAPELETIDETRNKLVTRQKDVLYRLRNIEKDTEKSTDNVDTVSAGNLVKENVMTKINMGDCNVILMDSSKKKMITPQNNIIISEVNLDSYGQNNAGTSKGLKMHRDTKIKSSDVKIIEKKFKPYSVDKTKMTRDNTEERMEVIDFTNIDKETLTNINEGLNYNKFGSELIRNIPMKPMNSIKFNICKK